MLNLASIIINLISESDFHRKSSNFLLGIKSDQFQEDVSYGLILNSEKEIDAFHGDELNILKKVSFKLKVN